MDCGNSAKQTNNRQWFHFSVRGGGKGVSVTVTFVGVMHSNMFTYEWMPVMALYPDKPEYVRIPGRATVVSLENMPSTPDYPLLEYKVRGGDDSDAEQPNDNPEGNNDETPTCTPTTDNAVMVFAPNKPVKKKKKAKKKKDIAMNLTFEFRMEAAIPRDSPHSLGSVDCPAMYIASNHPYSFSALQRQLTSWQVAMLKQISETRAMKLIENPTNPYKHNMTLTATDNVAIYFHREVLCHSLENRPVELLTITDLKGIDYTRRMPMISAQYNIPLSSSPSVKTFCTERPYYFEGKAFVVLTARVHPGECPGSHMMHGAISFLLNRKDARAQMLRERFVFLIVPMINPDGVVRGHSRVDANGIDLNRMYSTPSQRMQPVPFCLRQLLIPLAMRKQLSLFVDMHAHANKKGAFLYGNGLPAEDQVKGLLYAKLVSLNTPFL
ncbi:metallo-peptidase, Clan MC, Family M14, partial [Angomonas deanei]